MNRAILVLMLAVVLMVAPVQANDDEGYAAIAYPAYDTVTGEIEMLGTFVYTDKQSPDIELKSLFRPVMIDVNASDNQWKTMNANLASRYTPVVTVLNPGTDCSFKLTLDFAQSKEKPGVREMAAIMTAVLTTFADDPIAKKGVRFDLLNLPNVPFTSKTLYKPIDATIESLMALVNPASAETAPATPAPSAPATSRTRTTR